MKVGIINKPGCGHRRTGIRVGEFRVQRHGQRCCYHAGTCISLEWSEPPVTAITFVAKGTEFSPARSATRAAANLLIDHLVPGSFSPPKLAAVHFDKPVITARVRL